MGPPKKRPPRIPYSEKLRQYDYFEHRLTEGTEDEYHFFNPSTGETIFTTDFDILNRAQSMWAPPDPVVSDNAVGVNLYPEYYASRRWGRRKFYGWKSKRAAARHIQAVARGFLARRALSHYFSQRYAKILCHFSGYYYFYDRYDTRHDADATWYKPRLAFPDDIGLYIPEDPEDYLRGDKYSYQGFEKGPYICKTGVNSKATARAEQHAFIKPNEWRSMAMEHPKDIDIEEEAPLGTVIPWMDGLKAKELVVSEYVIMRTACHNGDWVRIMSQMKTYPDNAQIQLFGMFCFASTRVPYEVGTGVLTDDSLAAYDYALEIIMASNKKYNYTFKTFALNVLYNILSVHAGRAEFFSIRHITLQGEGRQDAIERHQLSQLKILLRYIERIPMETTHTSTKGSKTMQTVDIPTHEGIDIVEATLLCLSALAQEQDTREIMTEVCIDSVLGCLKICELEPQILICGLRLLYNFCYRCESGQACILQRKPKLLIANVRENFAGDPDVKRMLRRFELSIKENGWRGNVEDVIEKEMRHDDIESQCLRSVRMMSDEEFENMFASAGALGVEHASSAASHSVLSHQGTSSVASVSEEVGVNQQASFVSALGSTELL